jgi:hypothetical protein
VFKKILLSLFVFFTIISFSFKSHAEVDINKYEIISPIESTFSTTDTNIFINGKAPTGTDVNIDIYGTTDLTKKNFNLSKLPNEQDYINIDRVTVTSGNMGFFQNEISLVLGINKISLDFGIEELKPKEYIIYVYDKSMETQNIKNSSQKKISDLVPLFK